MDEKDRNDEMEIDLIALMKGVLSRAWIVILSFIIFVAATVFYLVNTVPIYEAFASMMVEPLSDTSISSLFDAGFSSTSNISTELEILNSRSTYDNAIAKLDLTKYVSSDGIRYSDFEIPLGYEALSKMVTVEAVSDTSYIRITVQNQSPEFARDFCNALADSYSDVLTGITRNSAQSQLEFITAEIPSVEAALRQAAQDLSDFQRDNNLLQMGAENQILLHQMSYLTLVREPLKREIAEAERYLSSFESSYAELSERRESFSKDVNVLSASENIITWYGESILYDVLASTSQSQASSLSSTQMSRYYALSQMMEAAETDLENYLCSGLTDVLSSVDALSYAQYYLQLSLGERKMVVIDEMLGEIDLELEKVPDIERERLEKESNVEVYQQLVLFLRQAQSETSLLEASITDNVTRIDGAILPLEPVSPAKAKTLLIGGFLGIFIGIAIAAVLTLMDKRIMSRDDLEKCLDSDIPVLGWIPLVKPKNDKKKRRGIALNLNPMSFISERYKQIASAMIYGRKLGSHFITVCSPGKNDGKSTTIANIAYALALNGKRILIVDMDLRMPAVENVFEVKHADKGIVDVLSGDARADEVIRTPFSELPNLNIVGVGKPVVVPSIVIQTFSIEDFINSVKSHYDYIFFDAPPLSYASELLTIARVAPEVLIIARAGISTSDEVSMLVHDLKEASANIIGVCLNGLALSDTSVVNKGAYGYGYGLSKDTRKERNEIRKTYVKKKSSYLKIYRKQLKSRAHREASSSFELAPLSFPNGFASFSDHSEKRENHFNAKDMLKTFEDYLSDVENDENAKGKKE